MDNWENLFLINDSAFQPDQKYSEDYLVYLKIPNLN